MKTESHVALLLVMVLAAVIVPGFFVVSWFVSRYNRLLVLRRRLRNAFTQIDIPLKQRYDLIRTLVETAQHILQNEHPTLETVMAARNAAVAANLRAAQTPENAGVMKELSTTEFALSAALGRLLAMEKFYPEFKANPSIKALMEELTSTDNKVALARQAYNDAVMTYNAARKVFPFNAMAKRVPCR